LRSWGKQNDEWVVVNSYNDCKIIIPTTIVRLFGLGCAIYLFVSGKCAKCDVSYMSCQCVKDALELKE
jgi:hypothetical protein